MKFELLHHCMQAHQLVFQLLVLPCEVRDSCILGLKRQSQLPCIISSSITCISGSYCVSLLTGHQSHLQVRLPLQVVDETIGLGITLFQIFVLFLEFSNFVCHLEASSL